MGVMNRFRPVARRAYRAAVTGLQRVQAALLPVAALGGLLSAAYYLLVSGAFWRENRAVASGLTAYRRELRRTGSTIYLLRRNIHRIEKGLIMKARREVFAVDYILAPVKAFAATAGNAEHGTVREADWMQGVLHEYFACVGDHPAIREARKVFAGIDERTKPAALGPFPAGRLRQGGVSYEQFHGLAASRKSVRWYLQRPVPREVIDKALVVAGLSPSACNRQPITFHVFDDRAAIGKVAGLASGAEGFVDNFPALVVVTGQLRAYFKEQDRHIIYIDGSLAAMSFIHALLAMGVASCVINWPDIARRERRMARQLGLASDERVVLLLSLGYPDPEGLVPFSQKKDLRELRRYNA
jgi:nitroreductase